MEPTRTETRRVNGQEIFIRHWGDENLPPLLMLHGFPEYGGAWRDLAPLLCQHFHCIAPDQRGYGLTTGWADGYETDLRPFGMLGLVRDAVGLVAALGHDRAAGLFTHEFWLTWPAGKLAEMKLVGQPS